MNVAEMRAVRPVLNGKLWMHWFLFEARRRVRVRGVVRRGVLGEVVEELEQVGQFPSRHVPGRMMPDEDTFVLFAHGPRSQPLAAVRPVFVRDVAVLAV